MPNPTDEALERVKPEKRVRATSHHAHHETEMMFVRDRKQIKRLLLIKTMWSTAIQYFEEIERPQGPNVASLQIISLRVSKGQLQNWTEYTFHCAKVSRTVTGIYDRCMRRTSVRRCLTPFLVFMLPKCDVRLKSD